MLKAIFANIKPNCLKNISLSTLHLCDPSKPVNKCILQAHIKQAINFMNSIYFLVKFTNLHLICLFKVKIPNNAVTYAQLSVYCFDTLSRRDKYFNKLVRIFIYFYFVILFELKRLWVAFKSDACAHCFDALLSLHSLSLLPLCSLSHVLSSEPLEGTSSALITFCRLVQNNSNTCSVFSHTLYASFVPSLKHAARARARARERGWEWESESESDCEDMLQEFHFHSRSHSKRARAERSSLSLHCSTAIS